jgi:hypothetical protein
MLGMTSESVRDTGLVVWNDPLAWTETMHGREWKKAIQMEEKRLNAFMERYVDPALIDDLEKELTAVKKQDVGAPLLLPGKVSIHLHGRSISWRYMNELTVQERDAVDITTDKHGRVWDVADSGQGAETYCLRFWKPQPSPGMIVWNGPRAPAWTRKGAGPYVLVIGDHCYFLEAKKSLWYWRLVRATATTGEDEKIIYEETDPRWNLSLVRGESGTGYLVRENSGLQQAFFIKKDGLKTMEHMGFFVLGGGATNDYFVTDGRGTDAWKAVGPRLSTWIIPTYGIPESVSVKHGLLVTRKYGIRSLWQCGKRLTPKLLLRGFHQISFNQWDDTKPVVRCVTPGMSTLVYSPKNGQLNPQGGAERYADVKGYFAKNRDVSVPFIIVSNPRIKMCSLLVIGYGAYGLPTNISTARWFPLLRRGWAIVFAFVRGGGDHTMAWANAARTWRREASVEDFECVIRAAQKETGISAKSTVVYGRSAGGILVGSAAARQVGASLFAGLYAEVPYLDVLRTTTNPDLPLTQLEYEEFGDPLRRIEDLVAIATISPMESIPDEGFPKLFALMRTGGNDREVLAYEPVKWILRARGRNQRDPTKLLAFEDDEGHFVDGESGIENRAVDLGILLSWVR